MFWFGWFGFTQPYSYPGCGILLSVPLLVVDTTFMRAPDVTLMRVPDFTLMRVLDFTLMIVLDFSLIIVPDGSFKRAVNVSHLRKNLHSSC